MMMAETYGHEIFHQSLARFFERDANDDLQMAFNATTTLLCSSVSVYPRLSSQTFNLTT